MEKHDIVDGLLDILREKMGMVFQSFNLFPNMNVVENVKLAPMKVKGHDLFVFRSGKEI